MQNFEAIESFFKSRDIFYEKDVNMKNNTSFKIGGICKFVCYPNSISKIVDAIKFCTSLKIPYFFLGNGSNLLFSDEGFYGVAICSKKLNKINVLSNNRVYCEAGVLLYSLCRFCAVHCFSNLEPLYGIPGSLGGAIFMNAGAYNSEIKDVLQSVVSVDINGNVFEFNIKDIYFSYRNSAYQNNGHFIFAAVLKFENESLDYINKKMQYFLNKRIASQPLNFPSAGSAFKRPKFYFAAKLIEECGLKGLTVGGAKVSEKHCGFIINIGGASCLDVKNLIKKIQKTVSLKKSVDLTPEIKFI